MKYLLEKSCKQMARNPATMVVLNKSSLSLFSSVLVHNFPLYVRCELPLKHITCQCKKWLFKVGKIIRAVLANLLALIEKQLSFTSYFIIFMSIYEPNSVNCTLVTVLRFYDFWLRVQFVWIRSSLLHCCFVPLALCSWCGRLLGAHKSDETRKKPKMAHSTLSHQVLFDLFY